MKNWFSLVMAVVMCISVFALSGCKKEDGNEGAESYDDNYSVSAHVDEDADILGVWTEALAEDSKSEKTIWRFEDSTTLNIIETVGGHSLTVGAAYNYNQETNELTYMILDTKKEYKVWGLSIAGGVVAGYEKYASGASLISSIAGGLINAGISIGGMYASTAIATAAMGALAASSLAIPGGVIIIGGAVIAVVAGIAINHLFTKLEIGGNTIEGHLNDFVDWLIFWD